MPWRVVQAGECRTANSCAAGDSSCPEQKYNYIIRYVIRVPVPEAHRILFYCDRDMWSVDPDPEGSKGQTKRPKKIRDFMFWKASCFLWKAGDFVLSLKVLHKDFNSSTVLLSEKSSVLKLFFTFPVESRTRFFKEPGSGSARLYDTINIERCPILCIKNNRESLKKHTVHLYSQNVTPIVRYHTVLRTCCEMSTFRIKI